MSSDPWARLDPKPSNLRGNRAEGAHPLDVYWVRRSDGARGLVFIGVDRSMLGETLPCLRGVEMSLGEGEPPELSLFLQADEHREVFQLLCEDVIEASGRTASASNATGAIFRRLEHWTEMLAAGRSRELSPHEVRGLMGELILLDTVKAIGGLAAALASWVAPDDHPQDFALANGILEVKTRLATSRPVVSISSLEQLEIGVLPLALWVIELTPDAHGQSLNSLVGSLMSAAQQAGSECVDRLRLALLRRGYEPSDRYDQPCYRCSDVSAFSIDDDFPRITRSATDLRIRAANYQLDLTTLLCFQRDPMRILTKYAG